MARTATAFSRVNKPIALSRTQRAHFLTTFGAFSPASSNFSKSLPGTGGPRLDTFTPGAASKAPKRGLFTASLNPQATVRLTQHSIQLGPAATRAHCRLVFNLSSTNCGCPPAPPGPFLQSCFLVSEPGLQYLTGRLLPDAGPGLRLNPTRSLPSHVSALPPRHSAWKSRPPYSVLKPARLPSALHPTARVTGEDVTRPRPEERPATDCRRLPMAARGLELGGPATHPVHAAPRLPAGALRGRDGVKSPPDVKVRAPVAPPCLHRQPSHHRHLSGCSGTISPFVNPCWPIPITYLFAWAWTLFLAIFEDRHKIVLFTVPGDLPQRQPFKGNRLDLASSPSGAWQELALGIQHLAQCSTNTNKYK